MKMKKITLNPYKTDRAFPVTEYNYPMSWSDSRIKAHAMNLNGLTRAKYSPVSVYEADIEISQYEGVA